MNRFARCLTGLTFVSVQAAVVAADDGLSHALNGPAPGVDRALGLPASSGSRLEREAREVQRIGVVQIVINEGVQDDGSTGESSRYTMVSRFHDLDEPLDRDLVLLADAGVAEGCELAYEGETELPDLVASDLPVRYAPADMTIGVESADGQIKAETPLQSHWALPASKPVLPLQESERVVSSGVGAHGPDRPQTAVRPSGREFSKLIASGSTLKVRGRDFARFGKIRLPDAPPLDLIVGPKGVGDSKRDVRRAAHQLSLSWNPVDDSRSLVRVELALIGATVDIGIDGDADDSVKREMLKMNCQVPDTGSFNVPENLHPILSKAAPHDVRLRVSRSSETWKQKNKHLIRTVVHTVDGF